MLLEPGGDGITIEVAHNLPDSYRRKVRYRMGEGVTGRVMQTGKAMVVPKVSQEPLFLDRFGRKHLAEGETSFICVPISVGKDVIGTISVDKVYDENASLEEDKRLLSIVASMIANDVSIRWRTGFVLRTLSAIQMRCGMCIVRFTRSPRAIPPS